MKVLSKEEEAAHYRAVLIGGTTGGILGCAGGLGLGLLLQRRWPVIRQLTIPFRAFFVTSTGTFVAIVGADRSSRGFETSRYAELQQYKNMTARSLAEAVSNRTPWERVQALGREYRYPIVTTSWLLSMAVSLGLVSRNRYLTTSQKLVQARMYAQGLTLLVLVASAGLEVADARSGKGNYETVKVLDPSDPTHQKLIEKRIHHESYAGEDLWKDMVESEEQRMRERQEEAAR
ncbi:Replication factor C, subunit RFC4 [Maublancomyces gigas]|uniref:Replication factor C, subunit RFC4 n=1 Tax=Discina gigas TaxID=1032678 RepID=A0ABR3GF88_9PEZI